MTDRIELTLKADLAEIIRLKEAIARYTEEQQFGAETCFELTLALEEAVANIIEHGELPAETGKIRLGLSTVESTILVELRDNGRPFNPLQAAPPDLETPFEERVIGGMGIFYLQKLMDELTYRHFGGENILSMRKQIS